MRRSLLAAACTLVLVGEMGGQARAAAYTLSNISLLGSPVAINDLGQVVGIFSEPLEYSGSGPNNLSYPTTVGFLNTGGAVTSLFAGAPTIFGGTFTTGINNNGQVIGNYGYGGYIGRGGFVYANGGYTDLYDTSIYDTSVPGAFRPYGINDSGTIVGQVFNVVFNTSTNPPPYTGISLLYSNGAYKKIIIPGVSSVAATGINNAGQIIGQYNIAYDPNGLGLTGQGFLDTGGVVTLLDVPGAIAGTTDPTAINNLGEVVGYYDTTGETGLGFLYQDGIYSPITVDGRSGFYPSSINDAGVIVVNAGIATPVAVPEPASITLLGMGLAALGLTVRRRRVGA